MSATPATNSAPRSFAVTARESLESIVVAFTLAFIFRAFIVEAFVIPTGSMAPTLYGQQVTHTCSTCGFEYAHGIEQLMPGVRLNDLTLKCPNCGSAQDKVASTEVGRPSSGDRILVHKWPLSVGGALGPKRWDVTVFKDPHNGTVNYIKRLVGKPGEILEIIQGDVYTASLDELRKADPGVIAEMDKLRCDLYAYAHSQTPVSSEAAFQDASQRHAALNARIVPHLKIQRKAVDAPEAQQSLWFNVYNQDFLPDYEHNKGQPETRVGWSSLLMAFDSLQSDALAEGRIPQDLKERLQESQIRLPENPALVAEEPGRRWRVDSSAGDLLIVREDSRLAVYDAAAADAWNTTKRTIHFKSDSDRLLSIRFTGKSIDDFYGYNYAHNSQNPAHRPLPVGDTRLAFTWVPEAGKGGLVLDTNRDKDAFTARLSMDGIVQIDYLAPGARKPVVIGTKKLEPFQYRKAVGVEFVNVDFRVSLSIDGQEVLASTEKQYAPRLPELLQQGEDRPEQVVPTQVKIGAHGLQCSLEHLELDRDVYYRSCTMLESMGAPLPGQSYGTYQGVPNPFYRWPGWGTQGWPIMLRDGQTPEYFMLGDNSPGSKDSRLWWEIGPHLRHLGAEYQVGTVPADQLIGRAFFVYWPSGYRRSWTADVGIIPNFGRMRWIR
jgi:signal peptidase I